MEKNLILSLLKNKFEWNLKELPKDYLIKKNDINFHSWNELSSILLIHEHWRLITLFKISIFSKPLPLQSLERVSCFILVEEFFHKKAFCIFSSPFTICLGTGVTNDWKTILDITSVLKMTIFHSSVRFRIFHISSTRWIYVTVV